MPLIKHILALFLICLVYASYGKRIHFITLPAARTPHFRSSRPSIPRLVLRDNTCLQVALSDLGLDSSQVRDAMQHVSDRSWPIAGAVCRVHALQKSINQSILDSDFGKRLPQYLGFLEQDFRTIYEDEHLVVSDKPFYTYMDNDNRGPRWPGEITLMQHLSETHPEVFTKDRTVWWCHNLDYATSGILVTAKSREAAKAVSDCFEMRSASKLYAALVFGHPPWERQSWNAKIWPSKRKFKQRISKSGKSAITHATVAARGVLKLNNSHKGREASLLWLEPQTGRRHQLRLHCSHAGFSIVGDQTYSDDEQQSYRMFLHAAALKVHMEPKNLTFEAPFDWLEAFEPSEAVRSPEGWPHAAQALCSGCANLKGGVQVPLH